MADGTIAYEAPPPAVPQPRRYRKRALSLFLLAIIAGPPLGGWVFFAALAFWSNDPLPDLTLSMAGSVLFLGLIYGYIFGGVRAFAGGLWIASRVWRTGVIGYLEVASTAAVVSIAGTAYLLIALGENIRAAMLLGLVVGIASIFAALACRWIAGFTGVLPR